jgi:hypothetical protein
MNQKPISPLRRRMIEDMTVRNFVEKTRNDYVRHVRTFAAFIRRPPDTATAEDLRRFHRIRHYGLLARPSCADNIARARELLAVTMPQDHNAEAEAVNPNEPPIPSHPCPCCGGRMITIETFARCSTPRHRPTGPIVAISIDTS